MRAASTTYLSSLMAALFFVSSIGCDSSAHSRAAVEPPSDLPHLIRQANGRELMVLATAQLPGLTFVTVKEFALPGILDASGQVTFDDRRVSTIISRVSGRIENLRVTQWDTVRRGEPLMSHAKPQPRSHVLASGAAGIDLARGSARCPSGNRRLN